MDRPRASRAGTIHSGDRREEPRPPLDHPPRVGDRRRVARPRMEAMIARKSPLNYDMIRKAEIGERAIMNIRDVEIDPVAGVGYFTIMPSATIVTTTAR